MALIIRTANNREIKLEKINDRRKLKDKEKLSYFWIAEEDRSNLKIIYLEGRNKFCSSGFRTCDNFLQ